MYPAAEHAFSPLASCRSRCCASPQLIELVDAVAEQLSFASGDLIAHNAAHVGLKNPGTQGTRKKNPWFMNDTNQLRAVMSNTVEDLGK